MCELRARNWRRGSLHSANKGPPGAREWRWTGRWRLTVDELRELVEVGRERGMEALLREEEQKEGDPLPGHARA